MILTSSKNDVKIRNCFSADKSNEEKQFAYAFISLCLVIEIINNEFITKKNDDKWEISDVGFLLDWEKDNNTNSGNEVISSKPPEWLKMAGLYYQKWNQSNTIFIKEVSRFITKRNGFVHNDKDILDVIRTNKFLDKNGKPNFLNHDIYNHTGFVKLFEALKQIIELL